jgi:hypothetical protein
MAIKFNEVRTKLGLDDVITFGKYVGCTVEDIIKDSPDYIEWLIKEGKQFYPSVLDELHLYKAKYKKQSIIEDLRYLPNIEDWFYDVPY